MIQFWYEFTNDPPPPNKKNSGKKSINFYIHKFGKTKNQDDIILLFF